MGVMNARNVLIHEDVVSTVTDISYKAMGLALDFLDMDSREVVVGSVMHLAFVHR
jgi:hypothetical protein